MTSIGSPSPFFFGGKKAYAVDRSLRFNDGDTAYLSRTPSSAGNRKTWTLSWWVKLCKFTVQDWFSCSSSDASATHVTRLDNNGRLNFQTNNSGIKTTNAQHRDPSAWYHFVVKLDTTDNTADDRCIIYVNGSRQSLSTNNTISQNTEYYYNTTQLHTIGVYSANQSSYPVDCYMAEMHFLDGTAYDPSYFGETDSTTGQWIPKKYTGGNYGTNGFYLDFSDTSALGKDSSGNNNNWTANNFSTSAGVGNDSVTDTPTNNFATLNPLSLTGAGGTFSNGNLDFTADSNYATRAGNISLKTGKWYWEVIVTSLGGVDGDAHGIVQGSHPNGNIYPGYDPNGNVKGIGWYNGAGGLLYGSVPDGGTNGGTIGAGDSALSAYTTNDVLGFASDIANGTLAFYKNGTLEYTLTGIGSHDWFPAVCGYGTSSTKTINFGQLKTTSTTYADANGHGSFKYSVPSGFLAMCTANFTDPTILLPNKHFDTRLYTGNGSTGQTITYDFGPDFVWMKNRSGSNNHAVVNTVLGRAKGLYPDSNSGDFNSSAGRDVSAFTSNGFTVGEPEQASSTNNNGSDIVAWAWNAGDTDGKTYVVKVVSDSGNKYRFDNFGTSAVTLDLAEGGTYIFNMDDASNASHPFSIGTAANGTVYTSGITYFLDGVSKTYSEYTSGFSAASTRRLHITVPASAPVLYYWCSVHSGMGGQINTNSTLGSSNFDGSIQTTVKANTTAGFSIVSYTGNGTEGATIGHGLGVTPNHIIWKNRDASVNWINWQTALNDTCVLLNSSVEAISASGNALFTYGDFNSTQLKLKTGTHTNGNNQSILAYCFSEVDGYSKFGSYKGNGSSDGVFVFTGFRPAWLMVKRYDVLNDWPMVDNKRNTYNPINYAVYADLSQAEDTNTRYDFLSNGFKIRSNFNESNASGGSYIYLCFAESPFKYARAR
jgi:hypothetical protein